MKRPSYFPPKAFRTDVADFINEDGHDSSGFSPAASLYGKENVRIIRIGSEDFAAKEPFKLYECGTRANIFHRLQQTREPFYCRYPSNSKLPINYSTKDLMPSWASPSGSY